MASLQQRRRSLAPQSRSGFEDDHMSSRAPTILPPIRVEPVNFAHRGTRPSAQEEKKAYFDSFEGKSDLERLRKLKTDLMNGRAPYRSWPRSADLEQHVIPRRPGSSLSVTSPLTQLAMRPTESPGADLYEERPAKSATEEPTISLFQPHDEQTAPTSSEQQMQDTPIAQLVDLPGTTSVKTASQTLQEPATDFAKPASEMLQALSSRANSTSPVDDRSSQLSNSSDAMEVDQLLAPDSPGREGNQTPSIDFPYQPNPWVDLATKSTTDESLHSPEIDSPSSAGILIPSHGDNRPVRTSRFASPVESPSAEDRETDPLSTSVSIDHTTSVSHQVSVSSNVTPGPSRSPSRGVDRARTAEPPSSEALGSSRGSNLSTPVGHPPLSLPTVSNGVYQTNSSLTGVPIEASGDRPSLEPLPAMILSSPIPASDRPISQPSTLIPAADVSKVVSTRQPKSSPRTKGPPRPGGSNNQSKAAKYKASRANRAATMNNHGAPRAGMPGGRPPQRTQTSVPGELSIVGSGLPPPPVTAGGSRPGLIGRFRDPTGLEKNPTLNAFRPPPKEWARDDQPGRPYPAQDDFRRNEPPGRLNSEDFSRGRPPPPRDYQRNTMPINRAPSPPIGRQYYDGEGYRGGRLLARSPSPLGGSVSYGSAPGGRNLKRTRTGSIDMGPHRPIVPPSWDPPYPPLPDDRRPYGSPPDLARYEDRDQYYRNDWRDRSPPGPYGRERYHDEWDQYRR